MEEAQGSGCEGSHNFGANNCRVVGWLEQVMFMWGGLEQVKDLRGEGQNLAAGALSELEHPSLPCKKGSPITQKGLTGDAKRAHR